MDKPRAGLERRVWGGPTIGRITQLTQTDGDGKRNGTAAGRGETKKSRLRFDNGAGTEQRTGRPEESDGKRGTDWNDGTVRLNADARKTILNEIAERGDGSAPADVVHEILRLWSNLRRYGIVQKGWSTIPDEAWEKLRKR